MATRKRPPAKKTGSKRPAPGTDAHANDTATAVARRQPTRVAAAKMSTYRGRSLTAAAKVLQGPKVQRTTRRQNAPGLAWQQEAWDYYDWKVGEYAFGVDSLAWAVSQVRLVAAIDEPNQDEPRIVIGEAPEGSDEPVSEADRIAAELVAGFAGGSIGQKQILRRVAIQVQVAGESYIVGRTTPDGDEVWEAYSRDEIKFKSDAWSVDDGIEKFDLSDDDILIHVWIPSPRKRSEPRSSSKPLLPVLGEIYALTQSIAAQVDSRLAGAGLLIFPRSIELAGSTPNNNDPDAPTIVDEVMDMMITPIKERDSAAAVVPIMMTVSDEAVGKIQYIRFDAPSDLNDADKREKAVARLARGLDLPAEKMTGMSGANHWSGWMIEENTIKGPVTNLASIIAHAITIGWYQPALEAAYEAAGIVIDDEAEPVIERLVWFDATTLEQRPDRSAQAQQVFDRGGLNLAALARENGFDEGDLPDAPELLRILLFQLIKNAPELAVPLLDTSGLMEQILKSLKTARDPVEDPPNEGDAAPEDSRALPERPDSETDAETDPGPQQGAA